MLFSYNWLQSLFEKQLPDPKELGDLLTMHSFETEEVKKIKDDWVLDIDVLPNRGSDCFSHAGVAREISAILNLKMKSGHIKLQESGIKAKDLIKLSVKNQSVCPRYTARVITGITVGSSPRWLKSRLTVLGLNPINNIVDIANYVMLESGQPLHAFDLDKILNQEIIVRKASKGEKIITLDNEGYVLDKDILVIADTKEPIAIAGIKGGKRAGVSKKTRNIVLESANFNPRVVRMGSKKIDLKTDASWRFEHGLDLNLTEVAINKAVSLVNELAGGEIAKGLVDFYPKKAVPVKLILDVEYVQSLLGVDISTSTIKAILNRLGFEILQKSKHKLSVKVPSFRLDIRLPEDLIEEIGRIYGYHKISSVLPVSTVIPPEKNPRIFWENKSKDILKEFGFAEIYSNSFINKRQADVFRFDTNRLIEVQNPPSADYQYLRPSLIPNLLKAFKKNTKFFENIKIFETGKIFRKSRAREKDALTAVIGGDSFYMAKGVIDSFLNKLGIADIYYDQYKPTPETSDLSLWHNQKSAEIKINNEEVGFLGEISPSIADELKLKSSLVIFDLDFEKLLKLVSEEKEYRPISPYPSAIRDISILIPAKIPVSQVLNEIEQSGAGSIKDVDLFDIYEGDEIPDGKKNLAFHIIYQAEDRTLSSKELDDAQSKLIKALESKPEWEVRK